jgi:hypothetical protein
MANKYYVGQTWLRIELTTGVNLTGATSPLIKYKKPSGTNGQFVASIDDAVNGVLSYEFTSGDLDEAGTWTFWAHVTIGGLSAPGEPVEVEICYEGEDDE